MRHIINKLYYLYAVFFEYLSLYYFYEVTLKKP